MFISCSGVVETPEEGDALVKEAEKIGAHATCIFKTVYADYHGNDETIKDGLVALFEPLLTHGMVLCTSQQKR